MTPKMRRLDGMTIYTGSHRGVGYVVTNAGVWWTHAGHGGVEADDEKAYKKAIQVIEENDDGKEQPGQDHKGAAEDQAGGACADGAGGASVGGGDVRDVRDGGKRDEAQ